MNVKNATKEAEVNLLVLNSSRGGSLEARLEIAQRVIELYQNIISQLQDKKK